MSRLSNAMLKANMSASHGKLGCGTTNHQPIHPKLRREDETSNRLHTQTKNKRIHVHIGAVTEFSQLRNPKRNPKINKTIVRKIPRSERVQETEPSKSSHRVGEEETIPLRPCAHWNGSEPTPLLLSGVLVVPRRVPGNSQQSQKPAADVPSLNRKNPQREHPANRTTISTICTTITSDQNISIKEITATGANASGRRNRNSAQGTGARIPMP